MFGAPLLLDLSLKATHVTRCERGGKEREQQCDDAELDDARSNRLLQSTRFEILALVRGGLQRTELSTILVRRRVSAPRCDAVAGGPLWMFACGR